MVNLMEWKEDGTAGCIGCRQAFPLYTDSNGQEMHIVQPGLTALCAKNYQQHPYAGDDIGQTYGGSK